jgi:hypothetical protein
MMVWGEDTNFVIFISFSSFGFVLCKYSASMKHLQGL